MSSEANDHDCWQSRKRLLIQEIYTTNNVEEARRDQAALGSGSCPTVQWSLGFVGAWRWPGGSDFLLRGLAISSVCTNKTQASQHRHPA